MDEHDNGLVIDCMPSGRNSTAILTAKLAGDVLAVESVNLTKPKARAGFVASVCSGRPGIDRAQLEAELLRLAANLAIKANDRPAEPAVLPELDFASIIRPERFITPEVSGLAVPTMAGFGDKPVAQWQLHLRWADGRRERRALGTTIDLPGSQRLWIHPEPCQPGANMRPGWSQEARQAWVDGASAPCAVDVFQAVCQRIAYFLDLPKPEAPGITATLALWVILTYCYLAWDAVPYLFIGGPLGSGKSRVFEILARLVFRPLASSNMTGAALFRTLHNQGGTLLLDEAERLRQTQDPGTAEILSMLLAGYKRGGQATRLEPVGETFKTVSFDVYGPKAMACIAGLPPALASRAIQLTMFRAVPGSDKPRRRIDADPNGWQRLRDDLHSLVLEHGQSWLELPKRVEVCPAMSGRDFELWQPVLALASWIESYGAHGLLGLLQEHALRTIDRGKDDQVADTEETLLRILTEKRANLETPQPQELLRAAQEAEPGLFRQWTAKGVANALKRYGITTVTVHGRRVYSRVTLADLRRIESTYGLTLGVPDESN